MPPFLLYAFCCYARNDYFLSDVSSAASVSLPVASLPAVSCAVLSAASLSDAAANLVQVPAAFLKESVPELVEARDDPPSGDGCP